MAYVNYVKENIAFIEYASDENVTANERLLWYALFHMMNKRAIGSDWPDEPISISNSRLLSLCPFSEDSLAKARNRLVQRGLIRYEAGKKNAASPKYAINYFCAELSTNHAPNVESYPISAGNMRGNMQGNMRGNMQGNMGGNMQGNMQGNMGGLYINDKPNGYINRNPNETYDDEDADAEETARARAWTAWAEGKVRTAFRQAFGREATPEEAGALTTAMRAAPQQEALMPFALRTAAMHGANNPVSYARTVYADYVRNCLLTQGEVEQYDAIRSLEKSGYEDTAEAIRRDIELRRRERMGLPTDDEEYSAAMRGEV